MKVDRESALPKPVPKPGDSGRLQRKLLHENWSFRRAGQHTWQRAKVPGCNYCDLLNSGEIDDPFFGANEKRLQWIEKEDWEYRCRFELSREELEGEAVLVFEGLDTYATVVVNGTHAVEADNMFRVYRVSCREQLRVGENEIGIVFRSPISENLPLHEANGFTYPAENDKSKERLSVYARKAPYQFGWDWGPRFVSSGIWRSAYLELFDEVRISNVRFRIIELTDVRARLAFDVQIDAIRKFDGYLAVTCRENDEVRKNLPVEFTNGPNSLTVELLLPEPKLWWPNGLGEPHLYRFDISVFDDSGCVDISRQRIGIRTIEVVDEDDQHGKSFYLKVNGIPVFMKGANYVPVDSFPDRVTERTYRRVFSDAVDANMNMLRVWGGGIYEDDLFYDLADEHGILIWQDFMFACSLYPADEDFLRSVSAEVVDNVARLRNHPSVALWCGNNEIEMGIECWDWPEKFGYSAELYERLKGDYRKLFHELLPGLVAELDGDRYYLSSTPVGFWERGDDGVGTSHFWGVWHGGQDFEEYRQRVSRFMTEYGFQSFPVLDSVQRFANEPDWNIASEVMQVHQRHQNGNQLILDYLKRSYPEPTSFEHFLYLSQVQQADGLRIAFEAHRSAMPYCMGSLYWQLNDCWPVASWSSVDYYGRWKALHYQARRSFAPVTVFAVCDGIKLRVHVVSDLVDPRSLRLDIRLIDFAGVTLWSQSQSLTIGANSSTVAFSIGKDELLETRAPGEHLVIAELSDDRGTVTRSTYYLAPVAQLRLKDPEISVNVDRNAISLAGKGLAKSVYVHVSGLEPDVNLSDNFFDLLPGQEKLLYLPDGMDVADSDVKLLSIYDTKR